MSSPRPARPVSGKAFTLGALGALAVLVLIVVVLFLLTGPSAPSEPPPAARPVDASTMCSALQTYPDKATTIAISTIPPDPARGSTGVAASYRQAANLIDEFCPSRLDEARVLRREALLYDPSGG